MLILLARHGLLRELQVAGRLRAYVPASAGEPGTGPGPATLSRGPAAAHGDGPPGSG